MTDFDGQIWVVQDNDNLGLVCLVKRQKKKAQVLNEKGREQSLGEDKLLWQYPARAISPHEWPAQASELWRQLEKLREQVDVPLLWETALEMETSDLDEMAELYFGEAEVGAEQRMALWQALATDRTYFKRKGRQWETRSPAQVEELLTQRARELAREQAQNLAYDWLRHAVRAEGKVEVGEDLAPFVERLECWMRGDKDKNVDSLLAELAEDTGQPPRELVFDILQKAGRLPLDADRDVIVAGLKTEFSVPVTEAAEAVRPWCPETGQRVYELAFSIDDEDTREVDDALALDRDGETWRLTVAVSDPASVVHKGDGLDREAMRRGTTVYLPTQTVLMLPSRISCDIASLSAEQIRSSILLQVWLDDEARVKDLRISREAVRVGGRLSYAGADRLIAEGGDETAKTLRNLSALTDKLRAAREAEGALSFNRPEYKIHVHRNGEIEVNMVERDSPSRNLVAETMILANHLAAKYAQRTGIPLIFRTQESPVERIDPVMLRNDPLAFHKARKFIKPSALSLHPGAHSGLGLGVYTQLTSPLRRFADLVMQRQLMACLLEEPLPYEQEELFQVLATAEHTAREAKMVEAGAKKRWFVQYLKHNWLEQKIQVLIVDALKGGYKVEMQPWGMEAFLGGPGHLKPGQLVWTRIEKLRPRAGQVKLKFVSQEG